MKKIPLTQGKYALVDDEDYGWLMQWKWGAHHSMGRYFASAWVLVDGAKRSMKMHRLILNAPEGEEVDHKNNNALDNRRQNIRICSRSENMRNRPPSIRNKSGYKGVFWSKSYKKWHVKIRASVKQETVGYSFCLIKAAKMYDAAAKKAFGDFAWLNFPERRITCNV